MEPERLQSLRALFPIVNRFVYFNNASTGPLPTTARKALDEFLRRSSEEGEIPYPECEAVVEETRGLAARLMHVKPEEIAFTRNASSGIIIAIGSIGWRKGDNLVMMKDAFPADYYPYHYLLPEVEKRYVTSTELAEGPDCVFRLVDRHTRAVALDWVHFVSGIRADIQAIAEFCRPLGVRFLVDATQGLGVVDMDFSKVGADFTCSSACKWLLSPQGIAILHVNPETLPDLRPYNLGWLSARWEEFNDIFSLKELKPGAGRFEEGTRNYLGIYGLHESLKLLLDIGLPAVGARIRALNDLLRRRLVELDFEILTPEEPGRSAGFISGRKPGADMAALHRRLTENRMICALRANCLRIAPHFYNTEEEAGRFIEVLTAC
jgi:selenocysteine lyase/cysteine desulfurase